VNFDEIGYNFAVHEGLGFVEADNKGRIVAWGETRCSLEENKTKGTIYSLEEYLITIQVNKQ